MAGFPAISEAWSSTRTCSANTNLLINTQQTQHHQKSISMFLNSQFFPTSSLLTSSPPDRRPFDVDDEFDTDRQGRVLGFDIFASPATRSNVNIETWNNINNDLESSSPNNSGLIWNSNGQTAATTQSSSVKVLSGILPAWFPWLPTKSQIQSLKVIELKEACNQRSLAKVRRKR